MKKAEYFINLHVHQLSHNIASHHDFGSPLAKRIALTGLGQFWPACAILSWLTFLLKVRRHGQQEKKKATNFYTRGAFPTPMRAYPNYISWQTLCRPNQTSPRKSTAWRQTSWHKSMFLGNSMEVQHKAPNFKKHFSQTALAKLIWYIFKFLEVKIIVIAIDLLLCITVLWSWHYIHATTWR